MANKNKKSGLTVKRGNANPNNIVVQNTQIDVRPVVRQTQDLVKWRNATKYAESYMAPRRVLLYDLYHDIMLDGHVIAVSGKRIDPITTANWQFVDKDNKPNEEVNELLDSIGAADLLTEIIKSRFWGYSMIECKIYKDEDGRWEMTAEQWDRKHMRPEKGIITYDQNGDEGFSVREGALALTVLEAGKPRDMGLLVSAAQYAILKRNNYSDWANFIEVFGNPIMDAEWDGFDEDQRLKLLAAITAMGNSGKLVRPAGTKVTFLEGKANATGQLQDSFKNAMNAEISKALLGTTETTESSSSSGYAQSKEHGEQDDEKNLTDLDYVRRYLNSRFIKIMRAFGLPVDGGKFIISDAKKEASPTDKMNMFVQIATALNLPINADDVYETAGMKKPEDFDAQMAAKKALKDAETQQLPENDDPENANTPPDKPGKPDKSKEKDSKKSGGLKLSFREKLALNFIDFFG